MDEAGQEPEDILPPEVRTAATELVWRCSVCGFLRPRSQGPPDRCPDCGAPPTRSSTASRMTDAECRESGNLGPGGARCRRAAPQLPRPIFDEEGLSEH